ncbi:hypothetical protein [Ralstonia pseudosolanacearum]|uniref:hypothetical protein n=1 Tax=Ralstonia pseudosolanacearum TaxID=1310165 RepID=UPI00267466D5|nr:hypothetical protein [Ralstonia pseudosolanacearum]MDO3535945.1 hypothetical protein [Ralstonia pseudosolanacearum]
MSQKPSSPCIETSRDEEIEFEATIDDYLGDYDEQFAHQTPAQCPRASRSHGHGGEHIPVALVLH